MTQPRLSREDLERLALDACPASDYYELQDNIGTESDDLLYKIIRANQMANTSAYLYAICDYLNKDKALHRHINWKLDPGKLTAAFEHAGYDLESLLNVFAQTGATVFVDISDLVTGTFIDRMTFFNRHPTKVGQVGIFEFYEDPDNGDESPLIVDNGYQCGPCDYYDLPCISEVLA